MKCVCSNTFDQNDNVYGYADMFLVDRNRSCTLIDVGCRESENPLKIKHHLLQHGIRCNTIGIDNDKNVHNRFVDRFVHMDVLDVRMPHSADAVTCSYVLSMCYDSYEFGGIMRACADMLKKDGIMVLNIFRWINRYKKEQRCVGTNYRVMTKKDALDHADDCFNVAMKKCRHGIVLSKDVSRDVVMEYLGW